MYKKTILFVENKFTIPIIKLAALLRREGWKTILLNLSPLSKLDYDFIKRYFNEIIIFDMTSIKNFFNPQKYSSLMNTIRNKNPNIIQFTGPDWHTYLMFILLKKYPRVFFAHDIWKPYFKRIQFKKNSGRMIFFNRLIERSSFKNAEGDLHKGPEDELKLLGIKTKNNDLQYLSGCMEEWLIKPDKNHKLSNEDGKSHLVYAGGPWVTFNGWISFIDIIKKITSQKIHFHIFCPYNVRINESFKKIERENSYFHMHRPLRGKKLNEELSKFDYGIIPTFFDSDIVGENFKKITVATKIFTYLEAGIPCLVSKELQFSSKIVESNNMGLSITLGDLNKLGTILKHQNYGSFIKHILKAQKKFGMGLQMEKLRTFYDKAVLKYRV